MALSLRRTGSFAFDGVFIRVMTTYIIYLEPKIVISGAKVQKILFACNKYATNLYK